ncbi:putative DNA primase/helicase [environmental Halophage eHP-11]|nr:putative DNA primase/helicase [environmental Halophage eHP-11]
MSERDAVSDYEIEAETFPADLLTEERWFVWAYDNDRKIPRAPWHNDDHLDRYESYKNAEMWVDFETADDWANKVPRYDHASCIPPIDDNDTPRLIFFDFDDCRDPETGEIHGQVWGFIQKYDLAGFLSTSGTGVHGFGYGTLPEDYKPSFEIPLPDWEHGDEAELEVYASSRFLALTGEHIASTPVSAPDLGETAHELFEKKGSKASSGVDREPDLTREEVSDLDTTSDISDIYDAVARTYPRDISVRSSETTSYGSSRDANRALDPSWANSESGTRLAEFDDHWLYRKGNHNLDALQLVALEERIIRDESRYPESGEFWDAIEELRARGADIPEYNPNQGAPIPASSVDAEPEKEQATDGGTATADVDGDDGELADSTNEDKIATDPDWEEIREQFRMAENANERRAPRFEAAMKLNRDNHFANIEENDTLYIYDDGTGIYEANGESRVREQLTKGLEEQYSGHVKSETFDQIRGRNTVEYEDMGGPEWEIAAQNCVIDLEENAAIEHSPDKTFMSRLGTDYSPTADAPQWRGFLDDVVPTEEGRMKLQEYAGYCLHHWGHPHHKVLFLVGPQASGKSTFLDTINAMLGSDTVSSLTPQQMTDERFGAAELFGKWANISNDIPKETVENTGQFKQIAAGDPLKAEEKFKDPFRFKPKAKHLFAANQLPDAKLDDQAFYRRILLVAFPETIPRSERDLKLDDKLLDELPGILNWALDGLERLVEQGGFTGDRSAAQTEATWSKWGDSVKRFDEVALMDADADRAIPRSKVYAAYNEYCRQESIPADKQKPMTRELVKLGREKGREVVDGTQQRCFVGVKFNGRGKDLLEDANKR